jgi:hypothetical protein
MASVVQLIQELDFHASTNSIATYDMYYDYKRLRWRISREQRFYHRNSILNKPLSLNSLS